MFKKVTCSFDLFDLMVLQIGCLLYCSDFSSRFLCLDTFLYRLELGCVLVVKLSDILTLKTKDLQLGFDCKLSVNVNRSSHLILSIYFSVVQVGRIST